VTSRLQSRELQLLQIEKALDLTANLISDFALISKIERRIATGIGAANAADRSGFEHFVQLRTLIGVRSTRHFGEAQLEFLDHRIEFCGKFRRYVPRFAHLDHHCLFDKMPGKVQLERVLTVTMNRSFRVIHGNGCPNLKRLKTITIAVIRMIPRR